MIRIQNSEFKEEAGSLKIEDFSALGREFSVFRVTSMTDALSEAQVVLQEHRANMSTFTETVHQISRRKCGGARGYSQTQSLQNASA